MTWVPFLVIITLVDNHLWVPVSYPALKDEASSVQLGLCTSSLIRWFGGSPFLHPIPFITLRAMFMLELPSAERNIL
jgi:hypothetical protein